MTNNLPNFKNLLTKKIEILHLKFLKKVLFQSLRLLIKVQKKI